jgi:hypothetical protein
VQALAADPETAARAIARPGDETVHRDGDPGQHLAIGSLLQHSGRRQRRDRSDRRPARAEIIAGRPDGNMR